ncbi:hypothetical protein C6P61_11385 [Malikia spinosa]|uniref:Glycosyltransferase 2-like domain-containing protein n=1 Tax=Malikia spinosa TaxID=86180 RepID=A0A2S9KDA5_9BURK|nr:glycosyltransferase [Malikia spinosa]PRD68386.1 hypothetical protein C6P61_11385 [Malikia spinosa]
MRNLRTQEKIIATWNKKYQEPLVSICCITYNHESYIEDAIRGFLEQETEFPYEILIHDDASTDDTAKIIKDYELKYPNIIKAIYQIENQYSKGIRPSIFNYERAKGKYIALCEGDDYWTCDDKLRIQIQIHESNPDIKMSFHSAILVNEKTSFKREIGKYRNDSGIVPVDQIIQKKFGQIPTASTIIQKSAIDSFIDFEKSNKHLTVGDIYIHFFGAHPNGAFYLNASKSVYRVLTPGSWTETHNNSFSKRMGHLDSAINAFESLDNISNRIYSSSLKSAIEKRILSTAISPQIRINEKLDIFRKYKNRLSIKNKISLIIITLLPLDFIKKINDVRKKLLLNFKKIFMDS